MEQAEQSARHVVWKPANMNGSASGYTLPSRPSSRPGSVPTSSPTSPNSSARGSTVDLPSELGLERPPHKRSRSKFAWSSNRPRHHRSKSSTNALNGPEGTVSSSAITRFAQRTQNNFRMWYLRHNHTGNSRRRTEIDKLREIEKSKLLFAQVFAVTPMVLISASSLQAEEGEEKKVPVVLQQLSIKVEEEQAKHYRNMLRIYLEYGSGLALIKWEIVRGYRDLLLLRAKLKARTKNRVGKKAKLPKLPRPKAFGLKEYKNDKQHGFLHHNDSSDEDVDISSSSDEDDGELADAYPTIAVTADNASDDAHGTQGAAGTELRSNIQNRSATSTINGQAEEAAAGTANSIEQGEYSTTPVALSAASSAPNGVSSNADSQQQLPSHHHHHHHRAGGHRHKKHDKRSYAKAVEEWLNRIKLLYTFRSDTNDLMQFLELSHLSLKLSSEYSLRGKEGTLIVRSRASEMGWRVNHWHPRDIKDMIERHTKKWVLVRDSYLVVVDNIYSTRIREVFFLDSEFEIKHIIMKDDEQAADALLQNDGNGAIEALPDVKGVHKRQGAKSVFLHLTNNEREMKLAATSERDLRRWQASIMQMKALTPWAKKHRFDSFAPVRKNVFGQWFVDGRDYMWVLSEAIENARDTILILDWWLSPELYLRRPPEGNQKWRLDRLLKRKAQQGVKIFIIVYRNVGPTIPIDSMWTKHSMLDLHENIHVMRSPNQLQNKSSLFWAHHEKLCVIDSTLAFNGGIDLCFGRWDTWQHTLTDDAPSAFLPKEPTPEEWKQQTQLFPGKDYSNARVKDFFELNRPFEDMYDRAHVPRMPWHDIHQMVIGQPARDLARHFVQRWNYVLRQKIPSRPTPLLLPPADFTQDDLERLQLTGTCEYQVLRSSGEWSLGLKNHEQSIQNAYLQLIEESEHFIYIENQFFITSTEVDGVLIENQIGNALVQRIIRAHERGEPWKAFILIPLMPGFEAEVDTDKASSVRVICQCQFNSISRGPNSIFYRLESLGIRPDQYISFFSLRKWGKFSDTEASPNGGRLVTELLYIHAKCMIVDDRVAIIGSANINERSMRGVRDSEVAVCVRDTQVIESRMAGKPWKAGKFAHTLRKRLMREHLGVDIDKLEIIERLMDSLDAAALRLKKKRETMSRSEHPAQQYPLIGLEEPIGSANSDANPEQAVHDEEFPEWLYPELHSFNWYAGTSINRGVRDYKKVSHDSRVQNNNDHRNEVDGDGTDHWEERQKQSDRVKEREYTAAIPDLEMENEAKQIMNELIKDKSIESREQFRRIFYSKFTKQDILRPVKRAADLPLPHTDEEGLRAVNNENIPIDPWQFDDPLDEQFLHDKWHAVAERNTLIFRLVFRCQPDDEVETWKDYKTFAGHLERFYEKQREDGGPNVLRKSGHHEPERVDKYVLDGSIKRPDPDKLRQAKMRAAQPTRSPVNSEKHAKEAFEAAEKARAAQYREQIRNSIKKDQEYERLSDSKQLKREGNIYGHSRPHKHSNWKPGPEANSDMNGSAAPGVAVPNQGDEFAPLPHVDEVASNGRASSEIEFPEIEGSKTQLKPTTSTSSARRRAMTASGASSAPGSAKPARKWGHFEHVLDAQVAEDMLQGITGNLVVFPTEWLNREIDSGNWNFQLDRIAPLEIYD